MTAGCARCGACCDPVPFSREKHEAVTKWSAAALEGVPDPRTGDGWAHWLAGDWSGEDRDVAIYRYDPAGSWRQDADFIAAHWTPDGDDGCKCDAFDSSAGLCTAQDAKPPVCRNYPWYGRGPDPGDAETMHSQCSYLADLPRGKRPEGSRPLIPLTVITRPEAA